MVTSYTPPFEVGKVQRAVRLDLESLLRAIGDTDGSKDLNRDR